MARVEAPVVGETAVRQQGALGESGCARGILDLRDIAWGDFRQCPDRRPGRPELRPRRQGYHLPQVGQAGTDFLDHRQQVPAPVLLLHDQPDRLGLRQHIGQFLCQIGRIDRDQRETGQGRPELDQHPFRTVRRPDGDMFAGREALQQGTRHLLGPRQKL